MPNRTSSFSVELVPARQDGVWYAIISDAEGSRGPGSKMLMVGNKLEMLGRHMDEFIEYRVINSHKPPAARYTKRKRDKARKRRQKVQAS